MTDMMKMLLSLISGGGGVNEGQHKGIDGKGAWLTNIGYLTQYIQRISLNDIHLKWGHNRLQTFDCYRIVDLFKSVDNRYRCERIYNEHAEILSFIGYGIQRISSGCRLCIEYANPNIRKGNRYNRSNNHGYSLTLSERGCVA